jgi:hypothetical protein
VTQEWFRPVGQSYVKDGSSWRCEMSVICSAPLFMFSLFSSLQADPVTECTEPNPAIWALRPDHEKLRNGHVSVVNIIIVIVILKFHQK